MTMQLGWNLGALNYYTPMWPCVNVAKCAAALTFQRAGQTQDVPKDADGAATAAWSTETETWNIVAAEKGSTYGLADSYTVITVDADHDLMGTGNFQSTVQVAGNTSGVTDGYYALYSVLDYRKFSITFSLSSPTGAVGTVTCAAINYRWSPSALMCRSIAGHYPSGTYDFYNGANVTFTWGFDVSGNLNNSATSWGTKAVVPSANGIQLLTTSNWSSGGGFKAIMPTYKDAYEAGTTFWHPTFTSLLGANNAAVVRHMDSVVTNNSNVRTWAQRCPQTAWNSLAGRSTLRPIKITASTHGESSTYFGSSSTLTLTSAGHGLTTGDYLYVRGVDGSPNRGDYKYIVEVVDVDTLRVKVATAQTVDITWGWADANVTTGSSYEDLIDLHNTLGLDIWICIPHLADDDFVTQLATLFATTLDASLKVYVEYSNETWQSAVATNAFLQGHYCECNARSDGTYNTQNKWAGKRARECFALWDAAYVAAGIADPRTRVYRVAPTQLASTTVTNDYLFGLTTGGQIKADVLAVAPYYYNSTTPSDLADLKTQCLTHISGTLVGQMNAQKAIADAAATDHGTGLTFVAYEGGQQITENNAVCRSFADSTERYDCDMAMFAAADAAGITLWCHYQVMYPAAASGASYQWGALQYMDDVSGSVYRPTWSAAVEYFGTPVGFRSPFPWLIGMMGGTTSTVYPPWKVDEATWFAPGAVESNTFHPGAVEHNVISS